MNNLSNEYVFKAVMILLLLVIVFKLFGHKFNSVTANNT